MSAWVAASFAAAVVAWVLLLTASRAQRLGREAAAEALRARDETYAAAALDRQLTVEPDVVISDVLGAARRAMKGVHEAAHLHRVARRCYVGAVAFFAIQAALVLARFLI